MSVLITVAGVFIVWFGLHEASTAWTPEESNADYSLAFIGAVLTFTGIVMQVYGGAP